MKNLLSAILLACVAFSCAQVKQQEELTVVGQSCWRVGMAEEIRRKDAQAARILQSVFPDRKVVMVDALAVNLGGGGVHCISMQQPVSGSKVKP